MAIADGGRRSASLAASAAKRCNSPHDAQPHDSSPKRLKHCRRHHHHHGHRHADSRVADGEVEDGEILDAAAAMDVDADSYHGSDDRKGKSGGGRAPRGREDERERRSSCRIVRDDGRGRRHDSRERYSRHRERISTSRRRSDRRNDARDRGEGRDTESWLSRLDDDHERRRWRDRSKDRHERSRDNDRHRGSTSSKQSASDGYNERPRSRGKGGDVDRNSRRPEEIKENSLNEEDKEEYQEKAEHQLAMQEEDDPDKIKEEARRRKEAITAKYTQQESPRQQVESVPSCNNNEEVRALDGEKTARSKDDNDSSAISSGEEENKHDSSVARIGKPDIITVEEPSSGHDALVTTTGLGNQSERPASVNVSGGSLGGPQRAPVRKSGNDGGTHIQRTDHPDNWDDEAGYYTYQFGELLGGRYEIAAAHGKGVFSTVVRAKDIKAGKDDPEQVAIKIVRNNDTMYRAGKQEISILTKLAAANSKDKRHCVQFVSSFRYRNHLCLVFESLSMNLRELLKKYGRDIGFKLTAVRAYSKQIFIALRHLKNCKVLHCDIKLDNILVNETKNVLKLCDFGSAMLAGMNEITPYLVSRFYRAPEIMLGLPYDHPLDMWSVGCCLFELYTGKILFPGQSNNDMLRRHMELKGPFTKKMLRKGAFTNQHFNRDLNFQATDEDPVTKKVVRRLILNFKPKGIGSKISNFHSNDPKMLSSFKDLLDKIFVLDPEKRITVEQALSHPFITGKCN